MLPTALSSQTISLADGAKSAGTKGASSGSGGDFLSLLNTAGTSANAAAPNGTVAAPGEVVPDPLAALATLGTPAVLPGLAETGKILPEAAVAVPVSLPADLPTDTPQIFPADPAAQPVQPPAAKSSVASVLRAMIAPRLASREGAETRKEDEGVTVSDKRPETSKADTAADAPATPAPAAPVALTSFTALTLPVAAQASAAMAKAATETGDNEPRGLSPRRFAAAVQAGLPSPVAAKGQDATSAVPSPVAGVTVAAAARPIEAQVAQAQPEAAGQTKIAAPAQPAIQAQPSLATASAASGFPADSGDAPSGGAEGHKSPASAPAALVSDLATTAPSTAPLAASLQAPTQAPQHALSSASFHVRADAIQPMQDLTQIVERLAAAREALAPASAAVAIDHADFGSLSLRFDQQRDGQLAVQIAASNPEAHRAVSAALGQQAAGGSLEGRSSNTQQANAQPQGASREGNATGDRSAASGNAGNGRGAQGQPQQRSASGRQQPAGGTGQQGSGIFA